MSGAEIPAARPLTEISADGGDVADLRAGCITGCGRQHRMLMLNLSRAGSSVERDQSAQIRIATFIGDGMQAGNLLDVHQALWSSDLIFHQREQVTAAGENFHFTPALAEQSGNLVCSGGRGVIKRSHCCLLSD